MKKFFAVLLILALTLASSALAQTTRYAYTRQFMDELDSRDIKYTYNEPDEKGNEKVRVTFTDDDLGSLAINVFFQENGTASYRCWNLVDFTCGVSYAYQICNELNNEWKYAKFYVDTTDNSITMSNDMELSVDANSGKASAEMLADLVGIIDAAKETLIKLK